MSVAYISNYRGYSLGVRDLTGKTTLGAYPWERWPSEMQPRNANNLTPQPMIPSLRGFGAAPVADGMMPNVGDAPPVRICPAWGCDGPPALPVRVGPMQPPAPPVSAQQSPTPVVTIPPTAAPPPYITSGGGTQSPATAPVTVTVAPGGGDFFGGISAWLGGTTPIFGFAIPNPILAGAVIIVAASFRGGGRR